MADTELPEKRRLFSILRILIIVILIVSGIIGYMNSSSFLHASSRQVQDNMAVFDVRLENIDKSISLHEKRIEELEQKLSAIPAAQSTTAGNEDARIATLQQELASLKASVRQTAPLSSNPSLYQAIHLLSAYHRLDEKVITGRPFTSELTQFVQTMGIGDGNEKINQAVAQLTPYAESGIPTIGTLQASFDDATNQLTAAQSMPPADATLWERFIYNIEHLVNIRRTDVNPTGNSVESIVSRAETSLEREEIDGAIKEIKSLPDAPRSNFSNWLEDAQASLQVTTVINQLEEPVMQKAFHTQAPADANKG